MLEKEIERYLVEKCTARKWECWKLTSPGRRGVPDRMIIMPGRVVFVEVKAPGKKPWLSQEYIAARLCRFRYRVRVVDSKRKVDELIGELAKGGVEDAEA